MRLLKEEQKEKEKQGEKVELMLMTAPKPDIVKIGKLIESPEDWDGKIGGDPSDNEPGKDDILPPYDSVHEARPIIKTEITTGP
ncbi:hypothetical protein TURU_000012 [Turdus rufiventris]|nr:hypothetical protein TURU_000012 [Turdus rufiventris]